MGSNECVCLRVRVYTRLGSRAFSFRLFPGYRRCRSFPCRVVSCMPRWHVRSQNKRLRRHGPGTAVNGRSWGTRCGLVERRDESGREAFLSFRRGRGHAPHEEVCSPQPKFVRPSLREAGIVIMATWDPSPCARRPRAGGPRTCRNWGS